MAGALCSLPFDMILVHWPTFSSGQDKNSLLQLQDSFGVKQVVAITYTV